MKLTKSQKLFLRAGRILEAYRHDLELSKQSRLHKIVMSDKLETGKAMLKNALDTAYSEYRKEQEQ